MESPVHQSLYRSDFYRLLSISLDFPNLENVSIIQEISEALLESDLTDVRLKPLLENVKNFYTEEMIPSLESEYFRIFSSGMNCPESEGSYYPVDRGTILGDVSAFYEAYKLQPSSKQGTPDSMKMELMFMSFLALKEGYAKESHDDDNLEIVIDSEKKFLQDHLGRWGFIFSLKLIETSQIEFYRYISMILELFLELEIQNLKIQPIRVDSYLKPKNQENYDSQFECAGSPPQTKTNNSDNSYNVTFTNSALGDTHELFKNSST
ncbi:MAG: molecular chaperone TorD family protein [Leptospiraceae bacterium]|nr:molecular chaperone TorD family protein [Leptospiraceae bacterium]MCK6379873.1 molecular chaperone TorD family protein [Leptospiraceae bacterium]